MSYTTGSGQKNQCLSWLQGWPISLQQVSHGFQIEIRILDIPSLAKLTGIGMYPADCGMAVFEQLIYHHSTEALMLKLSPTAKSLTVFFILDLDPTAQLDRY